MKNEKQQNSTIQSIHLICPNCKKNTDQCRPFYRHLFDQKVFGYFINCLECDKTNFVQVIYPLILREKYFA